jgi:subtilisin-like proprotein convertase family protein
MRARSARVLLFLLFLAATPAAAASRVEIDILPGEPGNLIAREPGEVVEVAVLGSAELDVSALLPESMRLAGATVVKDDAGATHALKDVNGDGRLDLVVRFLARDLRLAEAATRAALHGSTRDGIPIVGEDTLRTVAGALHADHLGASAADEKLPHLTVEVEAVPGKAHALAILGSDEVPAREIVLGSLRVDGQRIGKTDEGELGTYDDVNGDGREDLVIAAPPGVDTGGARSASAMTRSGRILGTEATEAEPAQESAVVLAPTAPSSPFTLFGQNPAVITIPDSGPATPYPSTLQVSGVSGVISKIRVTLERVTHTCFNDLDVLLVAPGGQSLVLTSDAGGCGGTATPTRLTFDDYAPTTLSGAQAQPTSGSYRPTNINPGDPVPAPAPVPPNASAMSVFQGIDPNGTWRLYVVDDAGGDSGSIAGGWTLDLVTSTRVCNLSPLAIPDAGASAWSSVSMSGLPQRLVKMTVTLNDLSHPRADDLDIMLLGPSSQRIMLQSDAGGAFSFVAQITYDDEAWGPTADEFPPASATVQPVDYEPGDSLPAPAPPGPASWSLSLMRGLSPNGPWSLFIADDTAGAGGGTLAGGWCLDVTAIAPMEGCAPAAVAIPGIPGNTAGAGAPYPSTIPFNSTSGFVENVEVTLLGLSHTYPDDLDILLQTPSGRAIQLLSDAGGGTDVTSLDVTFSTALFPPLEAAPDTTQLGIGPYYLTNYEGDNDVYPAPAPQPNATSWSDTEVPNGNWNLWVVDDAGADVGALWEGWCLSMSLWEPTYSACTNGANPITIPGSFTSGLASSYPWSFEAMHEGMSIRKIRVRIENLSHTWPDDLDMLLVGPTGRSAILMSDAGGGTDIVERTITFDDDLFPAVPIPDFNPIVTGTYNTANYDDGGGEVDNFLPPAPPGPHFVGLYNFRGTDPRGRWDLFITDDATGDVGGAIRWCIDFFSVYPPAVATRARWLDKTFLIWDVSANANEYAVLRGTPADLPNLLNANGDGCYAQGGPSQAVLVSSEPPPGSFFWYLVQGRNNNGGETGPVGPARIAGVETPRTANETGFCPAP